MISLTLSREILKFVNNMAINKSELEEIIKLMGAENIVELEIENNERKIKIKRCSEIERIAEQKIQKITTEIPARVEEAIEKKPEELYVLKSFMTGRFYRSNKEGGEPLVKENDKVELDQPLGVIEIMKSLLDIKLKEYKDCSGKFEDFTGKYGIVRKIEVENGSDVQYGTPLFLIEAIKE